MRMCILERIIDLKDITVKYGENVVLDKLNLYINKKEFITLLGPSGCGKTTTLRCIAGFIEPDGGDIIFEGKRINDVPPHKRKVNTIFQRYALFSHLNVYENIALPVELDGDTVDKKFMDEVVYMLALEDKLENMPNNLSGGQQQRVAIARALITKPAIVLADEPTGNLDSKTSADVLGLLKRTSGEFNQTIVMITHNNEIAQLADRIVRIEDGKIVG